MDHRFEKLGFGPADIMLPKGVDMTRWAVVACDQFTSEPAYWERVDQLVGEAPSTLRLFLPEKDLKSPHVDRYISDINTTMRRYMAEDLFETLPGTMVYVERIQSDGKLRQGLVGMVDLEAYDFTPGSGALIRATEATVPGRIPPRARVRRDAPIELPHVIMLIDDPEQTVIEPLSAQRDQMEPLYDFELMEGGGHIGGYRMTEAQMDTVAAALERLQSEEVQRAKYHVPGQPPLLFAIGDGNHSLATAKACFEAQKHGLSEEEWRTLPSRYALVEVVNNHSDALEFEAIHRVLFGVRPKHLIAELKKYYPGTYEGKGEGHCFAYHSHEQSGYITIPRSNKHLCVASVQTFLDYYLDIFGGDVDYIHGADVVRRLGRQPGNFGIELPPMHKNELFATVMTDGVLPRKTFSMGHAEDKRYYLEARKIVK